MKFIAREFYLGKKYNNRKENRHFLVWKIIHHIKKYLKIKEIATRNVWHTYC